MTRDELLAVLTRIEAERSLAFAQLLALELGRAEPEDRLLTVHEAASVLGVTVDWLYRHADEFRFTVRPGAGQLRFSSVGIQDYLRRERRELRFRYWTFAPHDRFLVMTLCAATDASTNDRGATTGGLRTTTTEKRCARAAKARSIVRRRSCSSVGSRNSVPTSLACKHSSPTRTGSPLATC